MPRSFPTTRGCFSTLIILLSATKTILAQQPCTAAPLASAVCKGIVDSAYPAISSNVTDDTEQGLQTMMRHIDILRTIAPTCWGYLTKLHCGSAYPACVNGISAVPCATTCSFAMTSCRDTLVSMRLDGYLPDCSRGVTLGSVQSSFPITQCLGGDAASGKLSVLPTQATAIRNATAPGTINGAPVGIATSFVVLLALYGISLLCLLDLAIAFTRFRRFYSVACWAVVSALWIVTIVIGQCVYDLDIRRAYASSFCQIQALATTALEVAGHALVLCLAIDVWLSARKPERKGTFSWKGILPGAVLAVLAAATAAVLLKIKANPTSLSFPDNLVPGFGPGTVSCTYLYPTNGWTMSSVPLTLVLAAMTLGLAGHAGLMLSRAPEASKANYSPTYAKTGTSLSTPLCHRFLAFMLIAVTAAGILNIRLFQAGRSGNYDPRFIFSDAPTYEDYVLAAVGSAAWVSLATAREVWVKTVVGSLLTTKAKGGIDTSKAIDMHERRPTTSTAHSRTGTVNSRTTLLRNPDGSQHRRAPSLHNRASFYNDPEQVAYPPVTLERQASGHHQAPPVRTASRKRTVPLDHQTPFYDNAEEVFYPPPTLDRQAAGPYPSQQGHNDFAFNNQVSAYNDYEHIQYQPATVQRQASGPRQVPYAQTPSRQHYTGNPEELHQPYTLGAVDSPAADAYDELTHTSIGRHQGSSRHAEYEAFDDGFETTTDDGSAYPPSTFVSFGRELTTERRQHHLDGLRRSPTWDTADDMEQRHYMRRAPTYPVRKAPLVIDVMYGTMGAPSPRYAQLHSGIGRPIKQTTFTQIVVPSPQPAPY